MPHILSNYNWHAIWILAKIKHHQNPSILEVATMALDSIISTPSYTMNIPICIMYLLELHRNIWYIWITILNSSGNVMGTIG